MTSKIELGNYPGHGCQSNRWNTLRGPQEKATAHILARGKRVAEVLVCLTNMTVTQPIRHSLSRAQPSTDSVSTERGPRAWRKWIRRRKYHSSELVLTGWSVNCLGNEGEYNSPKCCNKTTLIRAKHPVIFASLLSSFVSNVASVGCCEQHMTSPVANTGVKQGERKTSADADSSFFQWQ